MKRPDKYEFLKHGINAAKTLDAYDKYIDYLESQIKEWKELFDIDYVDDLNKYIDYLESKLKERDKQIRDIIADGDDPSITIERIRDIV